MVITVRLVHVGHRGSNIIPDDATFGVTMRSFSREARAQMLDNVVEVLRGIASAYGVTVDIEYREQYPPTINHDAEVDFLESTVREIHGEHRWARMPNPVAGAEDFSRVLEQIPARTRSWARPPRRTR